MSQSCTQLYYFIVRHEIESNWYNNFLFLRLNSWSTLIFVSTSHHDFNNYWSKIRLSQFVNRNYYSKNICSIIAKHNYRSKNIHLITLLVQKQRPIIPKLLGFLLVDNITYFFDYSTIILSISTLFCHTDSVLCLSVELLICLLLLCKDDRQHLLTLNIHLFLLIFVRSYSKRKLFKQNINQSKIVAD